MEQLYKEGKFIIEDGITKLQLDRANVKCEFKFNRSVEKIMGLIAWYDFNKLEDTDYYYLYNKEYNKDLTNIEESLKKVLSNDFSEVIDSEHFSLAGNSYSINNTVFWDVLNDIILVKGKENLKLLCIELEWMGYAQYGMRFNNDKRKNDFIFNQQNPSNIVQKVKKMDINE